MEYTTTPYERAKKKVDILKGFYSNLLAYCLVIPILWWINTSTTSFLWAIFPTVGWGIGLIFNGFVAYGSNPLWDRGWEARKIKEFMEKDDL